MEFQNLLWEALTDSDNTSCCQHFWDRKHNANNVNDVYSEYPKWKQMRLAGRQIYKRPLSKTTAISNEEGFLNDYFDI